MKRFTYLLILFVLVAMSCSKLNPFAGNDCPDIYVDLTVTNQTTNDINVNVEVIGDICIEDTSLGASFGRLFLAAGQSHEETFGENDAKSVYISIVTDDNVQITHKIAYIATEGLEITVTITHDGTFYQIDFS